MRIDDGPHASPKGAGFTRDPVEWNRVEAVLKARGFPLPLRSRQVWAQCMPGDSWFLPSPDATAGLAVQVGESRALPGHLLLRAMNLGDAYASPEGDRLFAHLRDIVKSESHILRLNLEFVLLDPAARTHITAVLEELGFRRTKSMRGYARTVLVDLAGTNEEIFGGFSATTRREIRRGERNGYRIRVLQDPGYAERLNEISRETFGRSGGEWHPRPWYARMRIGEATPDASRLIGLFSDTDAKPEHLLAFAWGVRNGDVAEYDDAGTLRLEGQGSALSYLLMWDLIRWAKQAGAHTFDLGGVTEPDRPEQVTQRGITEFKRRFSKHEAVVGMEWEFEPHPLKSALANSLSRAAHVGRDLFRTTDVLTGPTPEPLTATPPASWPAETIVLGSFETALGIVRALGRSGIKVHVLDHQRLHAAHSRYATPHLCPHPLLDPAGFLAKLRELAESLPVPPVLFISADEYISAVAANRDEIGNYCRFNISATDLLSRISDKLSQVELAMHHGIPVPHTKVVTEAAEARLVADSMPLPAFMKGRDVVRWRRAFGGTVKGILVETRAELAAALARALERDVPVIVQEVIPGDATQHMKVSGYTSKAGTLLAAFTLRKIRQHPHGFGFGSTVESIENLELLALGKAFFQRIGYHGTGSIEFKYDARDGIYKLIELNPRYWQQNSLAERIGMNLPVLEYCDLLGLPHEPLTKFQKGVRWVNLGRDLETARELWKRGELTRGEWWRSINGPRIWSDWSADDRGPGLFAIGQEIASRWNRLKRAVGVRPRV